MEIPAFAGKDKHEHGDRREHMEKHKMKADMHEKQTDMHSHMEAMMRLKECDSAHCIGSGSMPPEERQQSADTGSRRLQD